MEREFLDKCHYRKVDFNLLLNMESIGYFLDCTPDKLKELLKNGALVRRFDDVYFSLKPNKVSGTIDLIVEGKGNDFLWTQRIDAKGFDEVFLELSQDELKINFSTKRVYSLINQLS